MHTNTFFLSICLHGSSRALTVCYTSYQKTLFVASTTYMYRSRVQFSFHVRNYTSIIYMVLCTVHSASFSGTWTHVAPRSEPAMCICSAQLSRDTSGGFQFYALVGWRWGGPHSLEREKGMTLTRPNTSVAVWGMLPWRWGEGYFSPPHGAAPSVHRPSVHMPNWDTPTHPLWWQSSRQ